MKITKEFWVSDHHLDNIINNRDCHITIRSKNESAIQGISEKAVNKITISYEINREVTVKESDIDNAFNALGETGMDGFKKAFKQKLFGGGEND